MKEKLRRHWKKLTVAAVVVVVLALCVGKYWPAREDGPTYATAGEDLCDVLPYDLFAPIFGEVDGAVQVGELKGLKGPACQLKFKQAPSSMTVSVSFLESADAAEERYYAARQTLRERDAWELSVPCKKAQWSLGFMQAAGTAWDGNAVISVSIMLGTHSGSVDVNFGEPMAKFLTAVLAEVRKANQVSV
jgi:hypothetical protein